ncbi:hypothetical protein ONZ43_g4463 [Nemania bipapillata]|uniref:Uncharacterized protein n=1 Tax=Nemania bipapillata TaxID=110536 RepID=A0ACC2IMC4_9PEZI|nr:hypothetical protein ONZ43_g4463 [Nemania bipapillata]
MGTPFLERIERPKLDGYDAKLPCDKQSPDIPSGFIDAMSVREAVFVKEQGFPLEIEQDRDDRRSCHWVIYASVKTTIEPEERDPATNSVIRPRRSETKTLPIATLRVVPFPHDAHPTNGSRWVGGNLEYDRSDENRRPYGNNSTVGGTAIGSRARSGTDEARLSINLPFGRDRPTDFHDGKEPYVKLGRVAVLSEYRGLNIASQLWAAAKKWLQENPTFFNPTIRDLRLSVTPVTTDYNIPKWNGLVCVHAQEAIVEVYERWGFKVDEAFGRFYEDGVPHVGMFQRLDISSVDPQIS